MLDRAPRRSPRRRPLSVSHHAASAYPYGPPPLSSVPSAVTCDHRQGGPGRSDAGRCADPPWNEGGWSGDYIQQLPVEGAAPSVKTELKILYDDRNVYIAIRAHDNPALIHRYPSRRDDLAGDIAGVCFDSYFDKRSGFEFDLTAAGTKIDLV